MTFIISHLSLFLFLLHTADSLALNTPNRLVSRRDALKTTKSVTIATSAASAPSFFLWFAGLGRPKAASATEEASATKVSIKGIVTLPPDSGMAALSTTTTPALYITCRPDRADNVPAAILSGTRGKPPPILAARFANPTFPFNFELSSTDLTLEGAGGDAENDMFWWRNDDLIVSARFDSDGVAATRSPDDLVGRGIYRHSQSSLVNIPLTGRGAFGKFATGGK